MLHLAPSSLTAVIRLLVVDDCDMLRTEIEAFAGSEFSIDTLSAVTDVDPAALADRYDVIAISLDLKRGFELLEKVAGIPGHPPVIALAGAATDGRSIEHILTVAELHGAAAGLPKPLDIAELALAAALATRARRKGATELDSLVAKLERRVGC